MKGYVWILASAVVGLVGVSFGACGGDDTTSSTPAGGSTASSGGTGGSAGAAGQAGAGGQGGTPLPLGEPEVLAEGLDHPTRIVVFDDALYVATRGHEAAGALTKISKLGGMPTTIATAADADITALRIDATDVFWGSYDGTNGRISRVSILGGASTPIVSFTGSPADIELSTNAIYWSYIGQGSGISVVEKVNGTPDTLYEDAARATFLLLDASNLYFVDPGMGAATGEVTILNLQLMEPLVQQEQLQRPGHIASDADYVYVPTSGDGIIRRIAKEDASMSELASDQLEPYGVAVDAEAIYWTNRASSPDDSSCALPDGTVVMLGLEGTAPTAPTTIAVDLVCPTDIAVDDSGIYWIEAGPDDDHAAGRVLMLSKS